MCNEHYAVLGKVSNIATGRPIVDALQFQRALFQYKQQFESAAAGTDVAGKW